MIDPATERLLSLAEAARTLPAIDGKRPHPSTLWRWCTQGCRGGVKLEYLRMGRRVVTTEAALHRFMRALADAPAPSSSFSPQPQPAAKPKTLAEREAEIAAARERLMAAGVIDSVEG